MDVAVRRKRHRRRAACALAVLFLAVPAARADWLVTRAGARIETRGAWQVKGKLVVFTRSDGTLVSLRLSEVDLAASERATAEAKRVKTAPPRSEPAKKRSRIVLTDADFPKRPEALAAQDAEAAPRGGAQTVSPQGQEADAGRKSPVVVSSWRQAALAEGNGIEVLGVLQNLGSEPATGVLVMVELYGEAGRMLGNTPAVLSAPEIGPGASITFRVAFPGVLSFAEARFDVASRSPASSPETVPGAGQPRAAEPVPPG